MDNQEQKEVNIKSRILADINSGKLEMRPKIYFTLKITALVLVVLAIVSISVFILNFILFSIRINSHEALLSFGPRGWEAFTHLFPWGLLIVDVLLIVLLITLVRHFKLGYKIPILHLLTVLIVLTVAAGVFLDRGTPFNDRMYERGGRGLPNPIMKMYKHAHRPLPPGGGVCLCTILAIEGNTLTVQDTRNGTTTLTVVLPSDNKRATTTNLQVGDVVLIAGTEEGDTIQAFGVRKDYLWGERMKTEPLVE